MRRAGETTSRWHKGIDYSAQEGDSDRGDALLAMEDGTITLIKADTKFKHIVIKSNNTTNILGFAHIFRSQYIEDGQYQKSGDFVLKRLNAPNSGHFAIINLENCPGGVCSAYSDYNPAGNNNTPGVVTFNGINYTTTNQVSSTTKIAPVGDAIGGTGAIHAHLHLYSFRENLLYPVTNQNCLDPWEVVAHQQTDFDLLWSNETSGGNITWGQFIPKYDQSGRNYLRTRTQMRNATNVPGDISRYVSLQKG